MLPSAAGRHARPRATRAEWVRRFRAHLPFVAVMVVVAVAFTRIGLQHWREGTTELGLALLLAGALRASLTRTAAGLLAVRSRRVDIVTYVLFGLVVIAVALTITGGPLATR
jgi:predicted membrane channel-forming protein YqfA (hemolysin III family)